MRRGGRRLRGARLVPLPRGARATRRCGALAGLVLALCFAAAPAGAIARVVEGGLIRLHYNRAPLKGVAEEIGRALGERIAIDPGMPGRFTITIDRPVTRDEAVALLEAALVMQGYALIRAGDGTLQVLQIQDAASASPWSGPVALEEDRNKLVTTMLTLENGAAEEVASQMQHLVSKQDSLVPYPLSNSLILTGTERRVRRMLELGQALDAGGGEDLWIRNLRYRGALEVSEMLRDALEPPSAETGLRKHDPVRVWADERLNAILVLGSDAQLDRARTFVASVDHPPGVDTKIHVVRIQHRPASEVQALLIKQSAGRVIGDQEAGEEVFGGSFFAAVDEATNSVIIDADRDTLATVLEAIERLDRPKPRVQVDVVAYEITNPSRMRLGVDWFLPVLEPNADGTGNVLTLSSVPSGGGLRNEIGDDITFFGRISKDPLLIPFEDANGNVVDVVIPRETAVITADSRQVRTRSLMQPRLLMISGEEQRIFAGQNVPVLVGQTGATLSGVQQSNQVERRDVGVELRATARLGEEGGVTLDLFIEISRLTFSEAGDPAVVGPTIDERKIETTVHLEDGELALIGMSQEAGRFEDQRGTPFLSDIPVLGLAFRSGGNRTQDVHLVFAVQARVLQTPEEDLAESVRQRLALERSLSRVSGLRRNPRKPYAVLVTTRTERDQAVTIAESFEREGYRSQVGSWDGPAGGTRHDVYLTGYADLATAGAVALELAERGFGAQVMVLPGEIDIARSPGLRMLGADGP